jgi:hypothetical protein
MKRFVASVVTAMAVIVSVPAFAGGPSHPDNNTFGGAAASASSGGNASVGGLGSSTATASSAGLAQGTFTVLPNGVQATATHSDVATGFAVGLAGFGAGSTSVAGAHGFQFSGFPSLGH